MAPTSDRTRVVAIGTSTGGTQALEAVLTALPEEVPGIVVVQHMPAGFTDMFARRSTASPASACARRARRPGRARPGPDRAGRAPSAAGPRWPGLFRGVVDGPLINRHKPSVDVLFRSVARMAGGNALGIIMTGMGDDGALGLKEMHDAGAATIAEAEETCVVFGMPKEAIQRGAVDNVLPSTRSPRASSAGAGRRCVRLEPAARRAAQSPSSPHIASTRCFTASLITMGVPHSRLVSPGHLLVASRPILEPRPATGLAKSR
jgi:two-component system chemotaxis response regulator CheB